MIVLESARLSFRPLLLTDATQRYVDWLNDPEVNKYLETRHLEQTITACEAFIKQCNEDDATYLFGIFDKSSGQHIGNVKLGFIHPIYRKGQLSLFIGEKSYWNRGFASEVVKTITSFGLNQVGLEKIEAGCYEDNLPSLRVFLKSGYTLEGFIRSNVVSEGRRCGCFSLGVLKNEWH